MFHPVLIVSKLIDQRLGSWKVQVIGSILNQEDCKTIEKIAIGSLGGMDQWGWHLSK